MAGGKLAGYIDRELSLVYRGVTMDTEGINGSI